MSEREAFRPGDRVRVESGVHNEYEVLDGPFTAYVVKAPGDEAGIVRATAMAPIPPADPRIRVATESLLAVVADPGRRDLYARTVLAALDAHSETAEKPQPRRVRDRDGDVWEQQEDGTWSYVERADGSTPDGAFAADFRNWTWEQLTSCYRVTEVA